ncbi:hypothetical protein AMJ80_05855 [bacterium SM23_31]|nr:MAG: hypothetical protein AMJ80_05855 [bacterium SM23_31]
MKLAILSDIHGNLEALERCLQYLDEQRDITFTAVLGDIVGYGADPCLCIEKIRDRADIAIIGNHDAAVIETTNIEYFNLLARKAITWTQEQISAEDRAYLAGMPYKIIKDNILFTHGTPGEPEKWMYIFNWFDAVNEFGNFSESICFVGHSHVPGIFGQPALILHDSGPVQLDPAGKYIINVGSVGQPRDNDPRLSFAVLDRNNWTIEIVRLEYDVVTARQKIIDDNLPQFLGDRLLMGR